MSLKTGSDWTFSLGARCYAGFFATFILCSNYVFMIQKQMETNLLLNNSKSSNNWVQPFAACHFYVISAIISWRQSKIISLLLWCNCFPSHGVSCSLPLQRSKEHFQVYFISFLFFKTSISLSFLLLNGLYKPIKCTQDDYHKAFSVYEQKLLHSRRSWLPSPQRIPDMKAVNLMRTTSPRRRAV